jgi:hypothetical protein
MGCGVFRKRTERTQEISGREGRKKGMKTTTGYSPNGDGNDKEKASAALQITIQ